MVSALACWVGSLVARTLITLPWSKGPITFGSSMSAPMTYLKNLLAWTKCLPMNLLLDPASHWLRKSKRSFSASGHHGLCTLMHQLMNCCRSRARFKTVLGDRTPHACISDVGQRPFTILIWKFPQDIRSRIGFEAAALQNGEPTRQSPRPFEIQGLPVVSVTKGFDMFCKHGKAVALRRTWRLMSHSHRPSLLESWKQESQVKVCYHFRLVVQEDQLFQRFVQIHLLPAAASATLHYAHHAVVEKTRFILSVLMFSNWSKTRFILSVLMFSKWSAIAGGWLAGSQYSSSNWSSWALQRSASVPSSIIIGAMDNVGPKSIRRLLAHTTIQATRRIHGPPTLHSLDRNCRK